MNRIQYWFLVATTVFSPTTKYILDKRTKKFGALGPKYDLAQVSEDAVSTDSATKKAAIAKLNDTSAFWYIKPTKEVCEKVCKNLETLRAKDFLKVHGVKNLVAKVSVVYTKCSATFHVSWMLNRKAAEALDAK